MGMENHPAFRVTPTITATAVEALLDYHSVVGVNHGYMLCGCGLELADDSEHLTHVRAELMAQETVLIPGERLVYPLSVAVQLLHRVLGTRFTEEWKAASEGTGLENACLFLARLSGVFLHDGAPVSGIPAPDPTTGVVGFRCLDDPALVADARLAMSEHACEQVSLGEKGLHFICVCGETFTGDRDFENHRYAKIASRGVVFGKVPELSRTANVLARLAQALHAAGHLHPDETARLSLSASGLAHILEAINQDRRSF